jgi:uncharacterized protein (DUF1697 family)
VAAPPKPSRRLFAFLRAINVGGRNIAMAELRRVFEGLGLEQVETFIASGNLIFASNSPDLPKLEATIERGLLRALGYEVKTFLRTETELAAVAQSEPFKGPRLKSALALNVAFLSDPPDRETIRVIMGLKNETDDFQVRGREVYWLCQAKQSDSKFNNVRFEKLLKGGRATWRGMNTVRRLAAKYLLTP